MTNTVLNTAVTSSNPTLSLPQSSSSTFPNSFNQSHSHRIEESDNIIIIKAIFLGDKSVVCNHSKVITIPANIAVCRYISKLIVGFYILHELTLVV